MPIPASGSTEASGADGIKYDHNCLRYWWNRCAVWLVADMLIGLCGARNALANPNLASSVIAKTPGRKSDPKTEIHTGKTQNDYDD